MKTIYCLFVFILGVLLHSVIIGALYRPWVGDRNAICADVVGDEEQEANEVKDTGNGVKDANKNGVESDKNILLSEPGRLNVLVNKPHLSGSRPNVLISRTSLFQSHSSLKGSNVTLNSLAARRRLLGVPGQNFCRTVSICDLQPTTGSTYGSKPGSMYGSKPSLAGRSRNGLFLGGGSRSILGSRSIINGSVLNDQTSYMQIQDSRQPSMHSLNDPDDTNLQQTMLEKLNMDIFKSFSYLSLCLNNLLFCFGLSIVYVHLGSYAKDTLELTIEQSGHFFSAIGIANFFGR